MNDTWLPRIICIGLLSVAVTCIVAATLIVCHCDTTTTIVATVLTTLLMVASNVVSGLLGYVTGTVTQPKPTIKENEK
jgi:hypothetical protein